MNLIIVSNRLPFKVVKSRNGYRYEKSAGGLATGLGAYAERIKSEKNEKFGIRWIGWPGSVIDQKETVAGEMEDKLNATCVFLSTKEIDRFYSGFCNKTIWPLFHYFPVYTSYDQVNWKHYVSVNDHFCNKVVEVAKPGDIIWVQDYHLMLLPGMIRKKMPDATIGFFLHIPFPAFEIFRLLPRQWRKQIMEGLYGADLVGFHTPDYASYFLHCALRISGLHDHWGELSFRNRILKVADFPMGIDFDKYHDAPRSSAVIKEKAKIKKYVPSGKIVISIDRQDYSKGILNRLEGYELFLQNNPSWKEKVSLVMVVVPSRVGIEGYQNIKRKIDEQVGKINGRFGTLNWTPVVYLYHIMTFNELAALYSECDVALVTPLRDGMNLVAKEFIASRTDQSGVLILSEMAGAADELNESIIINPNNIEEISEALAHALDMPHDEQVRRITIMQRRVKNHDIFHWADSFLKSLKQVKERQEEFSTRELTQVEQEKLFSGFEHAASRTLFLDYDGTLAPFRNVPSQAKPSLELLNILKEVAGINHTEVVIISGRDRHILEEWFKNVPIHLVAEHGLYIREKGKKWKLMSHAGNNWKSQVIDLLHEYTDKLPGSFIEEKEFSLVFHYRKSDETTAAMRVNELGHHLMDATQNLGLQIVQGSKILEIRNAGVDKGIAALHWLKKDYKKPHFILAAGDDTTDEDLFQVLPSNAYSIKVGSSPSHARYSLKNQQEVTRLLDQLFHEVEHSA